ncbi:MAG: divergent PAP2 family protein [Anaerolineae bacterium]|nr:divergent PAP2 family protein [Anaerolineae bacterium]
MRDLLTNPVLIYSGIAWAIAQGIKIVLYRIRKHTWDWRLLWATGGMPSSHSAYTCSLATAIALRDGVNSSLFALAAGLAIIVMTDAAGVRRATGNHATVLNHILEQLFQGQPISEEKLKELLGHTPTQVFLGALIGALVPLIGMLWVWNGV